jgi:hypothetical protein
MSKRAKILAPEERLTNAVEVVKKKRRDHLFKKGCKRHPDAGRKKGQQNRTTRILKEAVILAAIQVGSDGKGKGELVGYLAKCAVKERRAFMHLMERILPYQVTGKNDGPVQVEYTTPDEVRQRFKERGLPVPTSLIDGPAISNSVN